MNRYVRDNRPHVRPVEKIELNENKIKRRGILAAFFACIGIAAIVYGFVNLVGGAEPGWETIEAKSASTLTCAGDFVFQYRLGERSMSASAEKKALQEAYTKAAEQAYWMFCTDDLSEQGGYPDSVNEGNKDRTKESADDRTEEGDKDRTKESADDRTEEDDNDQTDEGIHNIWYINRHPGEVICVDAALYHAFEEMQDSGNRLLYLGPVYQIYDDLFYCQSDDQAKEFDPYVSEEAADRYARFAGYASDESAVNLELLGDQKVRLNVSGEYKVFAEAEGSTNYIDFFWMKNAFILDYLTKTLENQGYRCGMITSFDGFSRVFDNDIENGKGYKIKSTHNIYDYQEAEKTVYPAAVMEYEGAVSIVSLRDYKRNEQDQRWMYEYEDGVTRTSYLGLEDGRCKSALHDLTVCAKGKGCAELLLSVIPYYLTSGDNGSLHKENRKNAGLADERVSSGLEGYVDEEVNSKFAEYSDVKVNSELKELTSEGVNSELSGLTDKGVYAVWCKDWIVYYTDPEVAIKSLFKNQDIAYQSKRL